MCLTNNEESAVPVTDLTEHRIHVLYTDHHSWLYSWLRRKLGNACDAADLAHDTLLRLWFPGSYRCIWVRNPVHC
ncbi:MAG: hypothetical protein KIS65_06080 [Nitrosomonas sp.]|nr:hypothetical protein [Nitrosomonas sp.]